MPCVDRSSQTSSTCIRRAGKLGAPRGRGTCLVASLCFALLALPPVGIAGAQEPAATATVEEKAKEALREDSIKARQAELKAELAPLRQQVEELEADSRERLRLQQVLDLYGRIEPVLKAELQVRRRIEPPKKETTPTSEEPAPPSIFALDKIYQSLEVTESERQKLENAIAASRDALAAAKEEYERAERERRAARTALKDDTSDIPVLDRRHAVELRKLDSRAALETVRLRELELIAARKDSSMHRSRADDLRLQRERIEEAIRQGTDKPPSELANLLRRETKLESSREGLEREIATAEARLSTAQDRQARSPSAHLLEEIETLTARRDALQQKASSTDARLQWLAAQKATLEHWRQVLRGEPARAELDAWKSEAEEQLRHLELAGVQREGRAAEVRERARGTRERLMSLPPGDPLLATLEARAAVLDDLVAVYQDDLEKMAAQRHLTERFVRAIDAATGHVSLREQVASFLGFFRDIWNYELTVIDDEGITAGELVIALALIVLGFIASRRVSHAFAASLQRRFRLDAGATGAIETVTFYLLLIIFVLLSLRTVNFPLTAFTILGGALAIGLGFGSQNVMNNFISGLILMLERPIRSGDLVAVEGSFGTVERIGARSTQIRATDNTHLIVPNSFFLENKVVNWTLSDDIIRTQVNVGVTYGSPTRKVEKLLRQVLDESNKILRNPEPVIVFAEFGDNSLNFEVYVWVRARSPMAIRSIGSELRFRIDDLFREAGIVIAFPQRDVHLDAVAPIEVRVLGSPSRAGSDG